MNTKNLKRNSDRTKAELQAMGRKGGKASGKKRRELKSTRELLQVLLAAPLNEAYDLWGSERLRILGFEESEMTQKAQIILSLMSEAVAGNIRAIELVLKLAGEFPADKAEMTISQNEGGIPAQDIRISYVDNKMNEVDHEIIHCPAVPAAEVQAFRKKH